MGSPKSTADDGIQSSYYASRVELEFLVKQAATHFFNRTATDVLGALNTGAAPLLARLLQRLSNRFELLVSEKFLSEAAPVLGSVGGALINTLFTDYFNKTAHFHFGLKSLERKHGADAVKSAYMQNLKR
jgi:hypothetical protein